MYETVRTKFDFKYFLTADSDIIFTIETPNLFPRLIDCAEGSVDIRGKPFGFIGLQQEQNGCHRLDLIWKNKYHIINRYDKEEELVYPNISAGIAGGCLFISTDLWELIGGYKIRGVYAGDDAHLIHDTHQVGFSYQVSPEISIIHPSSSDSDYSEHKHRWCRKGETHTPKTKKELEKVIKELEQYWIKRNKE